MAGMLRLLFLIWAGVTVSTVVDLQKRIIGGRTCGGADRLFHVKLSALDRTSNRESLCGGSLISNQWILTAAHCWIPGRTMRAYLHGHPNPAQRQEKIITVHHIFMDDQQRNHDIMLLQLPGTTQIPHVPLPLCGNNAVPPVGSEVQIAGYGSSTMGNNNERDERNDAATLQCAHTTLVDCTGLLNCLRTDDPDFYQIISYQKLLCYQKTGVDASGGDSGGGVIFNGRIHGVHSFTGNDTHACVTAAGSLNVCKYMDWIVNKTGIPRP